jgi:hypothetical protein
MVTLYLCACVCVHLFVSGLDGDGDGDPDGLAADRARIIIFISFLYYICIFYFHLTSVASPCHGLKSGNHCQLFTTSKLKGRQERCE